MVKKKEKKEKEIEVVDLISMEYPHSDIITIEEVVLPDEAIVDEEVEETINSKNEDVKEG